MLSDGPKKIRRDRRVKGFNGQLSRVRGLYSDFDNGHVIVDGLS